MTFLSDCCCLLQPKTLSKKNSPPSFEIFLAKKILRLERSEKRYDFSEAFSLLPSLVSDRALKSLSSSQRFFFFFPRGLSKGRGGGVPRETFKARARCNDDEEREREPLLLLLLQKREVFFYPRCLKPPFLKRDQKSKEKRNVPMRTTRRWWPQ